MAKLLQDKIALITGSSRGIGAAIARRYIKEGAHVIAVARNTTQLELLDDYARKHNSAITIVPLDLQEFIKIDELGYEIAKRFGHIDILVGNAATLGVLSPLSHIKPSLWENIIDLNLTANWRLIRSFDPLLHNSKAGRAIFVTSSVTKDVTSYWGPYSISKSGLEMLVKTYAEEISITNIKANLVDPGIVETSMLAQAFPGLDKTHIPKPDDITDIFVELASEHCNINGEILGVHNNDKQ
ncbi:putative oxidoreductase yciK [Rickettsiales bacterium Ac37b]|nr:putative oxidoreductase yciK [Rickettsiales bacterium Ac37b]